MTTMLMILATTARRVSNPQFTAMLQASHMGTSTDSFYSAMSGLLQKRLLTVAQP